MLIKEYRIPLPLTVEEYKIAQLYMIAKKSREESKGAGSGIEILVNEPYEDGPGGSGQYTRKLYHVGSHLPNWLKSLIPRSALCVEEEAWNCYPYTKTKYTCPFVEKFTAEIDTYYFPDNGNQENVFRLQGPELRNRVVDFIDIVNDPLHTDYTQDEDPTIYVSKKTGRGPLSNKWIDEYWAQCKDKPQPLPNGMGIMCAYKLTRVEFRYWGMQTKLEKFIHDIGIRTTMVKAHQQAWVWQDEWIGLTMEDIRQIEKETQEQLKLTMSGGNEGEEADDSSHKKSAKNLAATLGSIEMTEQDASHHINEQSSVHSQQRLNKDRSNSEKDKDREEGQSTSCWMESIVSDNESKSENDDEYFDCNDELTSLARWSSLEEINKEDSARLLQKHHKYSDDSNNEDDQASSTQSTCNITSLILVLHAGSILDANVDVNAKKSDITTFRGTIESVTRSHYPNMIGHVAIKLVPCPSTCSESLNVLSSMSPYSFDVSPVVPEIPHVTHDTMPLAAVPLLSSCTPEYKQAISKTIQAANSVYLLFINSEEGKGFSGKITIVGDSMGSILAYDALCKSNIMDLDFPLEDDPYRGTGDHLNKEVKVKSLSRNQSNDDSRLCFNVDEFFMFGSPLSLILAYRQLSKQDKSSRLSNPGVHQVYNLFHPSDPMSSRLEPLVSNKFARVPPVNVPRFQKFPLGTGQLYHLYEVIQNNSQLFGLGDGGGQLALHRKPSTVSMQSIVSGTMDSVPDHLLKSMKEQWWGSKRLDYALYCPEGLMNFPSYALPHLFHASYWESPDVVAFLLRQVGRFELGDAVKLDDQEGHDSPYLTRNREKWVRKRTSVKIKKVAANHRANDVIVKEGMAQILQARFMYGPFDMITLTGEKVDIYIMTDVATGCWVLFNTEKTDKNGRICYQIPHNKALGYGLYPVKMVVRGDQSFVEFSLAVIPPCTECIVFSIDGSFTASVSVTGRDPKVRACAVDVVRHWQELGYLILYITGRPDIQQSQVLSWLSQHNFPLGLVSFADGLSTDPLGHKAFYLKSLIQEHEMIIHAAYGSSKDISVYSSLGLTPSQIYIVGKVSKKHHIQATILSDGYASHLTSMHSRGRAKQPLGNARMLLSSKVNSSSIRNRSWGGPSTSKLED